MVAEDARGEGGQEVTVMVEAEGGAVAVRGGLGLGGRGDLAAVEGLVLASILQGRRQVGPLVRLDEGWGGVRLLRRRGVPDGRRDRLLLPLDGGRVGHQNPENGVAGGDDLGGDVDVGGVLLPGIAQHTALDDLDRHAEVPCLSEAGVGGPDLLRGGLEGDVSCAGTRCGDLRQGGVDRAGARGSS